MEREMGQEKKSDNSSRTPVITLKNLYRMMTQRDVLLPSYQILPAQETRGMTLNSFWESYFRNTLPEGTDLSFFSNPHMRRTLNRLMNRNGGTKIMSYWFKKLSGELTPGLIEKMVWEWTHVLNSYHADRTALDERLRAAAQRTAEQHDLESEEMEQFLMSLCFRDEKNGGQGLAPTLVRYAYTLSWMTIFALLGAWMRDLTVTTLLLNPEASCEAVYQRRNEDNGENSIKILTREYTAASRPIEAQNYIGRKKEMEAAFREMQNGNGKVAVCGIGGIGKTEFSRQLIRQLQQAGCFRRFAYVQCGESLMESLESAFPELGDRAEMSSVKRLLEEKSEGRTLLVVDQMNAETEDDGATLLAGIECSILITTRASGIRGFTTIALGELTREEGRSLFALHHPYAKDSEEMIDALCGFTERLPLAIILFAGLCRIRFWPAEKLLEQMEDGKFEQMRYVQNGKVVYLCDVFRQAFDLSGLTDKQGKLMRLMAGFPYRNWLPEALIPFTEDVTADREELADCCQMLNDLGWLMRGETGYAIHPMIAETVRLQPLSATEFPKLWSTLECGVRKKESVACQTLISMVEHTPEPNLDIIRCLTALEARIGTIPWVRIPERIYEKHWVFLEHHMHTDSDEIDFQLNLGLRDIVALSRIDRLGSYLKAVLKIMERQNGKGFCGHRKTLYILLEYASATQEKALVEKVFRRIRPERKEGAEMAGYLISWSMKQRRADHDPAAALASLRQAEEILAAEGMTEEADQQTADLYYRKAICNLDLGRAEEARMQLEKCLWVLESLGNAEDSAKIMSTRSTFAVSLWLTGKFDQAMAEYRKLCAVYLRQKREGSLEYVMMKNNMALLLEELGRTEEAEQVILRVLKEDNALNPAEDIRATHARNAAMIMSKMEKWKEAKPLAEEAVRLRTAHFGPDSPWTADAEAVYALIEYKTGKEEEARERITRAYMKLVSAWGKMHRHTKHAEQVKRLIMNG